MVTQSTVKTVITRLFISVCALVSTLPVVAMSSGPEKVTVMALMRDTAILMIDGERRVLRAGQTSPEQVTLIRADTSSAVVTINGREETLFSGMVVTPVVSERDNVEADQDDSNVVLWQEGDGFFRADGTIDGHEVRFLVDTGANIVALNEETALAAGIDLAKGRLGVATTASGEARMVRVFIKELKIGNLTAYDVEAGVIYGRFPLEPLLGQSFLSSVKMNRDGTRLELEPRW